MLRDRNGQIHAGSIGLFDDADEITATEARIEGRKGLTAAKEKKKAARAKQKQHDGCTFWRSISRMFGFGSEVRRGGDAAEQLCFLPCDEKEDQAVEGQRMFDQCQVDWELESPFYEELGLVRIKARNERDVEVVHMSQVRKDR